jgi:hypothetical protein
MHLKYYLMLLQNVDFLIKPLYFIKLSISVHRMWYVFVAEIHNESRFIVWVLERGNEDFT